MRPAINVGLSVSRVGGNAQEKSMKQVAGRLRLDLAQFREMESFAQFGTELDNATIQQLERGKRLVEILKQPQYKPMPQEEQVIIIFAGVRGLIDEIDINDMERFQKELFVFLKEKHGTLLEQLSHEKVVSDSLEQELTLVIEEFKKQFVRL